MLLYYLTVILQIYCLYHAYKNRNDYYWYFIIFFVPVIGCIIYLFTQVVNRKDVVNIKEEISTIINPTKKINDLQKLLQFSETFQNKINLADAYLENKDFKNAILYYKKALEGSFRNDSHTINKLLICHFYSNNFDKVIECAKKINLDKDFQNSIYFYGLALEKKKKNNAKTLLEEIISEINSMSKNNARKYKYILQNAEQLINEN